MLEAAERETKEESGLNIVLNRNYFYIFRCQDKKFNIYGFKARPINGDVVISEEHAEFKWIAKNEWANFQYTPSVKATMEQFFK